MELEESDKMDKDNRIIDELKESVEYQRAHIIQLESALKQETLKNEEIMRFKSNELQKSNDLINDLRQKLANCISVVDSKNIELQNLQTALGQYYAESEAKMKGMSWKASESFMHCFKPCIGPINIVPKPYEFPFQYSFKASVVGQSLSSRPELVLEDQEEEWEAEADEGVVIKLLSIYGRNDIQRLWFKNLPRDDRTQYGGWNPSVLPHLYWLSG